MQRLYESYKNNEKVALYLVYVREIHPVKEASTEKGEDSESAKGNRHSVPQITQHKTVEDRITAASKCLDGLDLTIPTLIDGMDDSALKAFHVRAAATVVVDVEGNVAFFSTGPTGTQPKQADEVIRKLLGLEKADSESQKSPQTEKTRSKTKSEKED